MHLYLFYIKLTEAVPESCGYTREISSTSQTLAFPGSGNYENNQRCQWTLTSPDGRIRIDFVSFNTEPNYDYLLVSTTIFHRFVNDNFRRIYVTYVL